VTASEVTTAGQCSRGPTQGGLGPVMHGSTQADGLMVLRVTLGLLHLQGIALGVRGSLQGMALWF
jgi:hypothetical protein